MLTVKWCLTPNGLFLKITGQNPVNRDPDGSIEMWEDEPTGYRISSCGGPDWDGSTLFTRGTSEDSDQNIIRIDDESGDGEPVLRMIWRYNKGTSNNTLEHSDIFEHDTDIVREYDRLCDTTYANDGFYDEDKLEGILCS